MKRNSLIFIVIIVLVGIAVYQNFVRADKVSLPKEQAPKVGFLAPSFTLEGFDNQKYTAGGPRDKVMLINFWYATCPPCNEEAPDLVKMADKYKDDLVIYAVNSTELNRKKDAKDFVDKFQYTFPVMWDPDDKITSIYNVYGWPTSFIVDRDGVIRDILLGLQTPENLEKRIKAVINRG